MKIQFIFAIIFLSPGLNAQHIEDAKQLIETERYKSAEILLERELENTNVDPEINYLLVKSYLEQDKISEAEKYVTTYLPSAKNENADPVNRLAYARYLLNSGQKQAAENILSALLADKKNKKNPELLLRMAEVVIEEKDGDATSALTWLELAGKKDKQNTEADIMRGLAYRKLGDATNAYIAYQHAIKNDPKNVRAYYLLGKIFTAQKNPDIYME
ncbi:MAG TPA: tetratricopeptide repeat protein, partial [Chitinophagaceae bacterium]|nr:tetratricopeptide repeat protein [Chitinophagaceae bacterium]